jgi:hypothetical protein
MTFWSKLPFGFVGYPRWLQIYVSEIGSFESTGK